MDYSYNREIAANRLAEITQRVGYAVWQLQELENVSAEYFVLVAQAKFGMGEEAWNQLEAKAQKKTFGQTIQRMTKEGLLTPKNEKRFQALLRERNWLVHQSRQDSRGAVYGDQAMIKLTARLDQIAEDALQLLREISTLSEHHAKKNGVTSEFIDRTSKELLKQWREMDNF